MLKFPKGVIKTFLRAYPVHQARVTMVLAMVPLDSTTAILDASRAAAVLRKQATKAAQDLKHHRSESYYKFQEDQLRSGAGALHALNKVTPLPSIKPITTDDGYRSIHP